MERLQILYADDDHDDIYMFEKALKDLHFSSILLPFSSGAELISEVKQRAIFPNLIFLDINMPGMNGFECLQVIRAMRELDKVPVIIFSTSDAQQSIDTAISLGASKYITKPTSYDLLKQEIASVLQHYTTS